MTPAAEGPAPRRPGLLRRTWWLLLPVTLALGAVALRSLFAGEEAPDPQTPVTLSQLAETRTVPVRPGTELVVNVGRGDIVITVGEPGFVRFTSTRYATAATAEAAAAALETVHVRISDSQPELSLVVAVDRAFDTRTVTTIEVPPGLPLKAETLAGDLLLDGAFTGRIEAGTGSGTIEVRLPALWQAEISADSPEVLSDFALEPVGDGIPTVYRTPGTGMPALVIVLRTLGGPVIVRQR